MHHVSACFLFAGFGHESQVVEKNHPLLSYEDSEITSVLFDTFFHIIFSLLS